jgi:Signal peptidase (SPase) II
VGGGNIDQVHGTALPWRIAAGVPLGSLLADQVTKWLVRARFDVPSPPEALTILPWPIRVSITFAKSSSDKLLPMMGPLPEELRRLVFSVMTVGAAVVLGAFLRGLRREERWLLRLGLPLVLSGMVGNLFDEAYNGYATSFIDVQFAAGFRWRLFNLADLAISAGLVMCLASAIVKPRQPLTLAR